MILTDWLRDYGLLSLFIGTFFEGEGVLLASGGLAHEGILPIVGVWLVGALGAYVGHIFYYSLGRYFKGHLLVRFPRLKPKIERVMPIIQKHPWLSIFILQYLYGMRLVGAITLGLSGMSWRVFLGIEALNCLIWAGLIATLGYAMTAQALAWYRAANRGALVLVLLLISLTLILFFIRKATKKKEPTKG
jgi:membrane protein DedA with SNARE-associated domain